MRVTRSTQSLEQTCSFACSTTNLRGELTWISAPAGVWEWDGQIVLRVLRNDGGEPTIWFRIYRARQATQLTEG